MPVSSRTFRVFVSSTFSDLHAERDALHRKVFPALQEFCESRGCRFQPIDLRWGVREEAALNQRTMEICLAEIARCQQTGVKPNFIVLLGDRYGWRPVPACIPAEEFAQVLGAIGDPSGRALVEAWYRLDENAVPAAFVLRPRVGIYADDGAWREVEGRLRGALEAAARLSGLSGPDLLKYSASATHQEILRGLGPTAESRAHVFAFLRSLPDPPPGMDAGEYVDADPEDRASVRELKEGLRRALGSRAYSYDAGWDGSSISAFHLDALCADALGALQETIAGQLEAFESESPAAQERRAHEEFARDRVRQFMGRERELAAIAAYADSAGQSDVKAVARLWEGRVPLILSVSGAPGSGKSAVVAKAASRVTRAVVIQRFVGITASSTNGIELFKSVCAEIIQAYGLQADVPSDAAQLRQMFVNLLDVATADRPLVIFIDALDQLPDDDPMAHEAWLPGHLPAHARVVMSTASPIADLPLDARVEIGEWPDEDAERALAAWLGNASRALQPHQHALVMDGYRAAGRMPLYLKLAFEEARHWASFTAADSCRRGTGSGGLVDTMLDRMADPGNHGPLLVSHALGALAASRVGLTEGEMLGVLSSDQEVMDDFAARARHTPPEPRLPVVIWSRLLLDLEPYLNERRVPGGSVIAFFHRQLARRVAERFLAGGAMAACRSRLASYFSSRPFWLDAERRTPDSRVATERAHQQIAAGLWADAAATLTDYRFMLAKCQAFMGSELAQEFSAFLAQSPPNVRLDAGGIALVAGAVQLSMPVVLRDWCQLPSQLTGRLLEFENEAIVRLRGQIADETRHGWLRPLTPSLESPGGPLQCSLVGHAGRITAIAVTPDGRHVVSGSGDRTLRVWNLPEGTLRTVISGRPDVPVALAIVTGGRRVVTGGHQGLITEWDLDSGEALRSLEGFDGRGTLAVSRDGRKVIGPSGRGLTVWDLEQGREIRTVGGCGEDVARWAVTPDAGFAVTCTGARLFSGLLTVWNLDTGEEVRALEGAPYDYGPLAVTPDGRRVAAGAIGEGAAPCGQFPVTLWDLATGAEITRLVAHASPVTAIAFSADGRLAVSSSEDGVTFTWDLASGRPVHRIALRPGEIVGSTISPDASWLVAACRDTSVKVWNLDQGAADVGAPAAAEPPTVLSIAPDGLLLAGFASKPVQCWDMNSGRALGTFGAGRCGIEAMVATPAGHVIGVTRTGGALAVWDLTADAQLCRVSWNPTVFDPIALSPDGRRLLAAHDGPRVVVWDTTSGQEVSTFSGHTGHVCAIAVSVDSRIAYSCQLEPAGTERHCLKAWDLETGELLSSLDSGRGQSPKALVGMPDCRHVIASSHHSQVAVFDAGRGRRALDFSREPVRAGAAAVTRDGRRVVAAFEDGTLHVWKTASGRHVASYTADAGLTDCVVGADGATIAAADAAGRLHVLRIERDETRSWPEDPVAEVEPEPDLKPAGASTDDWVLEGPPEPGTSARRTSFSDHMAELRRVLKPVPFAWAAATFAAVPLVHGPLLQRILVSSTYGCGPAYVLLCVQVWRFTRSALASAGERRMVLGAMAGLPAAAMLVGLGLAPVDAWWSARLGAPLQHAAYSVLKGAACASSIGAMIALRLAGLRFKSAAQAWIRTVVPTALIALLPGALYAAVLLGIGTLLAALAAPALLRSAGIPSRSRAKDDARLRP